MWDDQQDKEMMRNQMVAIVLMSVLLVGWFYFFSPPPAVEPAAAPVADEQDPEQGHLIAPGVARTQEHAPGAATPATGPWPNLPAPASEYVPETDDVVISDDSLELTFTRIGARLKSAKVLLSEDHGGPMELLPAWIEPDPTTAIYPLGLRFSAAEIGDSLDYCRWEAKRDSRGNGVTFEIALPDSATIRKRFELNGRPNVVTVETGYTNRESATRRLGLDVTPAYTLNWGPGIAADISEASFPKSFVWYEQNETVSLQTTKLADSITSPEGRRLPDIGWIGLRDKYFLVAMTSNEALPDGWLLGDETASRLGLSARRFDLAPGETHVAKASVYLGPMHLDSLRSAWPTLPDALRFFESVDIMDTFAKLMLRMLNWIHANVVGSYGVAIIILTLGVRLLIMPLNIRMIANGKAMKALQPEIDELRKEFGEDQQVMSQKMMELYRERGVNPLSGCFPMLLQMPIFIALYRMLWQAFELRGAGFLWIEDLSQPDALFRMPFLAGLPFLGDVLTNFNLLPILGAAAMLVSMRVMPTGGPGMNPQQKMMMNIMPVMFSMIMYNFSSGLNLYVLTSTVLGIVQQFALNPLIKPPKPKPRKEADGKKKKDFYTRALERRKEMEKADKDAKKARRKKAQR